MQVRDEQAVRRSKREEQRRAQQVAQHAEGQGVGALGGLAAQGGARARVEGERAKGGGGAVVGFFAVGWAVDAEEGGGG